MAQYAFMKVLEKSTLPEDLLLSVFSSMIELSIALLSLGLL
jgi:hypothetical protein